MLLISLLPSISLLFAVILWILYRNTKRDYQSLQENISPEPNIENLENNLRKLIENNKLAIDTYNLQQNLKNSPTNIIASYLQDSKKDLKGFHLFQLIFSLIKNQTEDYKIIKILRHYLPSCSTSGLYALLRSCKEFLNLSQQDNKQKELLKDLNQNRLRSTLMYLQQKLNQIFNQISSTPPDQQKKLIEQAAIYGLIFASFCKFYNYKYSQKILQLSNTLSPKLFSHWHSQPHFTNNHTYTNYHQTISNNKKTLTF